MCTAAVKHGPNGRLDAVGSTTPTPPRGGACVGAAEQTKPAWRAIHRRCLVVWAGPNHNGRLITSSVVSDRANFELYYAPFESMIKAGVGSIMCSCKAAPPRPAPALHAACRVPRAMAGNMASTSTALLP